MTARTLPHALEAEKCVLGAILINADLIDKVRHLRPESFFRAAHATIYGAMLRIVDDQKGALDLLTLKNELDRLGQLEDCGGPAYLSALTDGVPRSLNAKFYSDVVVEKAQLRSVIGLASTMLEDAYEAEATAADVVQAADRGLVELQREGGPGRLVDVRARSSDLFNRLEYRSQHKGELLGIGTGFPSLDELTLGWQPGDLVVVAARPSIGKTSFVLNSAIAASQLYGKRVAIFSFEMKLAQLEYRLLAILSKVEVARIRGGYLGESDFERMGEAMAALSALTIWIDDRAGQTVWDIRAAARRMRAEDGLDLLVIDYFQLMPGSLARRGATRNEELTDVSRRLKQLADELSVPVILLSQLNRAGEARQDKRPQLSDLRETGALEQDADGVLFLHRKHHGQSGTTQAILEKQRNGPTGTVNVTFSRETQCFTDGGEDEAPTPAAEATAPAKPKAPRGWKRGHR